MALPRVCMKNSLLNMPRSAIRGMQGFETRRLLSLSSSSYSSSSSSPSPSSDENGAGGNQVAVSKDRASRGGKRGLLQRMNPWNVLPFRSKSNNAPTIPALGSLGNALVQVSDNLNRLLENWSPSRLLGRVKEDDKCYKLRYEVPGLSKEDLKITVEDGFLVITGEREEEEGEDGSWYSETYGYYNTSVLLPEDAKVDEIKARVKDGVLLVTIPRSEDKKRDVKEVEIH